MSLKGYKPVPKDNGTIQGKDAVKGATVTTGTIEHSPYSLSLGDTIAIAPVENEKFFGMNEHLTFKFGRKVYTDQRGIYVYLNGSKEYTPVHFSSCFRGRPVSSTGDVDLLDQFLLQKKIYDKAYNKEGLPVYTETLTPCTDFDDPAGINYLRFAKPVNDWDVICALAGKVWKVVRVVYVESRIYRAGTPPIQRFIPIPILQEIGKWEGEE
jgi:hypothetical protein